MLKTRRDMGDWSYVKLFVIGWHLERDSSIPVQLVVFYDRQYNFEYCYHESHTIAIAQVSRCWCPRGMCCCDPGSTEQYVLPQWLQISCISILHVEIVYLLTWVFSTRIWDPVALREVLFSWKSYNNMVSTHLLLQCFSCSALLIITILHDPCHNQIHNGIFSLQYLLKHEWEVMVIVQCHAWFRDQAHDMEDKVVFSIIDLCRMECLTNLTSISALRVSQGSSLSSLRCPDTL